MPVHFESNGQAIQVTLSHTTDAMEPVLVQGFLGIAVEGGLSGDMVALNISRTEWQFDVPDALSVSKGDTVYVTLASVTEHEIPGAALSTTAGAGKKALFKATANKNTSGGTGKHWVTGILLPEGV